MYKLKTKASFDSAHFLKDYDGKCSNIHGHRWTVEIEVGAVIHHVLESLHHENLVVIQDVKSTYIKVWVLC